MGDIIQIIKALEEKGFLVEGTTETTANEVNEQRGGFLGMLLGTLAASLLGNLLSGASGKGIFRAGDKYGKGVIRAGEDF